MTDSRNEYDDLLTPKPKAGGARAPELLGKYDRYLADEDSRRAQAHLLTAPSPDDAARANKISRQVGVPAGLIDGQANEYETMLRQRAIAQASQRDPRVGSFLANPRAAAVAQDDIPSLAGISRGIQSFWAQRPKPQKPWLQRARDFAVNLPSNVGSALLSGTIGLARGVTDTAIAAVDVAREIDTTAPLQRRLFGSTLYDQVRAALSSYSEFQGREQAARRPDYEEMPFVERSLIQGVESVPGSAAALWLAGAGAPSAGLGFLGVSTGGTSYREGREAGLNTGQALTYGISQAAIEVATEKIPVMKFLHDTQVGTPFFKRLTKNMVAEQIGEQAATALQDLNQWAAIDVNKGKTFGDYLRERPEAAAATALAVAATVGSTNVAIAGVEKIADRVTKAAQARESAATLGGVMDAAAKSKLRERDPETFREGIEHLADGSPAENVYLPIEAIDTYMQGEGFTDESGFFAGIAGQLEEARATGGDVVVPLADVAAQLAGTPAWEALKEDARVNAGGWSAKEAAEQGDATREALDKRGEEIASAVFDQAAKDEPAVEVFNDVRQQLVAAGFAADAATKQAQLFAASREAWGARLGMTAMEYHQANPVEFRRGGAGPTVGATTVMDQAAFDLSRPGVGGAREIKIGDSRISYGVASDGSIELISLRTPSAKRGKGAARAAVKALTEAADAVGASITLGASPLDRKTRLDKLVKFYRSEGFEPTGRKINMAGEPEMRRPAHGAAPVGVASRLPGTHRTVIDGADIAYTVSPDARSIEINRVELPDDGTLSRDDAIARFVEGAAGNGQRVMQRGRVLYQSDNPVFYSELARAIDNSKTAKAPASQWKATLQNAPGVKAEELEWTGLLDVLDFDPKAVFTREQLSDIVRAGGIVVDEVVLGDVSEQEIEEEAIRLRDAAVADVMQDYDAEAPFVPVEEREDDEGDSVWVVGDEEFDNEDDARERADEISMEAASEAELNFQEAIEDQFPLDNFMDQARQTHGGSTAFHEYSSGQGSDSTYRELLLTLPAGEGNNPDRAPDTHWDQPRVVAHARFSEKRDVDGKRVLFIEEVQSDWHQKGRTKGYEQNLSDAEKQAAINAKYEAAAAEDRALTALLTAQERYIRQQDQSGGEYTAFMSLPVDRQLGIARRNPALADSEELRAYNEALLRMNEAEQARSRALSGIPNAPFKSTWPQLITKRMIRWAVDNGFERVAWINGDQQNGGVTDQDEGVAEFYEKIFPKTVQKLIGKYDGKVTRSGIPDPIDLQKAQRNRARAAEARRRADEFAAVGEERQAEALYDGANMDEQSAAEQEAGVQNAGFDITPKLADAAGAGLPLFQGARGQIALYPDRSVITLFENSDLSTLIHETGHLFLEELKRNAALPNAPADVKADWAAISKWFADNNVPIKKGAIPRDAHELFARGFERYAMEGKAPSSQLQAAFTAFRSWLLRIYQVVQNLRSPITPEVREVFDRMLATQDAIDSYSDEQNAKALFTDAAQAGMTDAEFDAYQKTVVKARTDAFDALLYRTMERIRVRRQKEYNEQARAIRRDATQAVLAEPRFRALRLLRTGKLDDQQGLDVKIDSEWLVERYGADAVDRLPQGIPIYRKGGTDADEIAAMTGFASGAEMVEALFDVQRQQTVLRAAGDKRQLRAKLIDDATRMAIEAENLADPLTDGSLEEEAVAAIETERHGEVIASENRALARRTGTRATPYKLAREWAKRKIMAGKVVDVASRSAMQRYARAAAKSARLAETAMLAQDIDEAFRQKQAQLLNHALLAEAKIAADETDRIVAKLNKLAKRAAMKSVDQDYFDRVHDLLERFNFRPASQRWLDEAEGFRAWAAGQAANGFEVLVPERLNDDRQHYTRVAVEDLFGLNDAVDSLMSLGRHKQKLLDAKDERDFADVIKRMLTTMRELPARKLPKTSVSDDSIGRTIRQRIAGGIKVSTIALDLDHQNPNGPMSNLLTHRASEASLRRTKLREKALQPISDRLSKLTGKQWKRLRELVTIPELSLVTGLSEDDPRLGQPLVLSRLELIGVALNTGNSSNFEKMTKGERWNPQALRAVLDRELSREDWEFVQAAWESVETLWPSIVATERQLSGVVPEKVDATPVITRHGTFAGGYWPVVYDSARSVTAAENEAKAADDMFGQRSGLATAKGHTITRTKAIGPMVYSIERVLFNHIDRVITRVAYAQYARDVLRVMREPRIAAEIDLRLGREYREEIPLWLADQINVHPDVKAGDWGQWLMRYARQGIVAVGMGLRWGTGVAQISGLMSSLGRLGGAQTHKLFYHSAKQVVAGVASMAQGKRSAIHDFVFERSAFMEHRLRENTVEVERASKKLQGKHSWKDHIGAWMFWHIGMVDLHIVSIPTWITGYRKGIDEGMTEDQAIAYADSVVATSQGSGRQEHLARWQRSRSEGEKLFTMFYTPFNVILNAQWEAARGIKRGDWTRAANLTFFFLVGQTIIDALLSGDWPDDDDDDGLALNATQWVGRNFLFGLFSGVPIVRDAAAYGERQITGQYATFGGTPIGRIFEDMTRAGSGLYDVWTDDKEFEPKMVPGIANTVGTVTHLPLGQPGQTIKFLWEYERGDVQPQSISEWYLGLTKGKVPEKKDEAQ